ncbi:hypothetical protein HHK36_011809 [Tetracentron sinense]|uniref:MADS-box domain-containing protein n=1 Tax=Tetracentron sinense TaxID=13715 RepID=A0A834ZDI8_TETSI|nr:hypothetical protein HHK36_011809 [Tetracentron sinense]
MGRAKLKIRRLEAEAARQNTFLKRKFGIMKKLHELSVLCDIDCLLLMFPPMGKPILTLGEKRRNETSEWVCGCDSSFSLQILKRIYGKMSENIDVDTIDEKKKKLEEMHKELMEMNSRLVDAQHRLSQWTNLNNVNNLAHIRNMEETLVKSLDLFRNQKVERNYPKQHPESGQEHLFGGIDLYPAGCKFFQFNNME